ncbi:hypothetical protein P8452_38258 [Trifolium repens]|nr:hypothetical protein P8452_38258 [Trifolium repens]
MFIFGLGACLNKVSTFASILNKPKNETAKFQALHENFYKEKATSLKALQDIISKYEDEKEKLFMSILGKKEKSMMVIEKEAFLGNPLVHSWRVPRMRKSHLMNLFECKNKETGR